MLSFEQARQLVVTDTQSQLASPPTSLLPVTDSLGHILAQEIRADREYPPFNRSTRDGYAVRAREVTKNSALRCIGEIKAGDAVFAPLDPGTCI